jgi:hypothetical protein
LSQPDLVLKAMDKVTGNRSGKIGAAWLNADGSVQLSLDPGVSITYNTDIVYMLFPNDRPPKKEEKESQTWHPK